MMNDTEKPRLAFESFQQSMTLKKVKQVGQVRAHAQMEK